MVEKKSVKKAIKKKVEKKVQQNKKETKGKKVPEKKPEEKVIVKNIKLKPLVTEKAIMMIESQNTLGFEVGMKINKSEIKNKVEDLLGVKVQDIRTHIKRNKKYAYVKLNPKNLAIDVATKLGMI